MAGEREGQSLVRHRLLVAAGRAALLSLQLRERTGWSSLEPGLFGQGKAVQSRVASSGPVLVMATGAARRSGADNDPRMRQSDQSCLSLLTIL
ncbi:hypothetical protein A4R35_04080 [Thermogemmatispora tikiterensis]|uniref:Uncharacterized protein n=1 Tax=Thermogemmatispora tikiterensis TaxID=1825093 RepID=A0A328VD20_9CHLR|nr:hypothetical protein A4R35_04080 [Thermogemmatispora tikiterensis]